MRGRLSMEGLTAGSGDVALLESGVAGLNATMLGVLRLAEPVEVAAGRTDREQTAGRMRTLWVVK